MTLEYLAMTWLRFEKDCPYAFFERSPRYGIGQPDVIGITKAGFLLEIEIKRSLSDFAADFAKPHRKLRNIPGNAIADARFPKQFWYLAEPGLADKIKPRLPEWAGLLTLPKDEYQLKCVVKSPVNEASTRLTAKEKMKAGHCMSNQILAFASAISSWKHLSESDWGIEYRI